MIRCAEFRYNWRGEDFRVLVADDVVSIPGWAGSPGWSMGGFGPGSMSIEWLLHEGGLPGPKGRKVALADMICRSLAQYHGRGDGDVGDADERPRGPFMPCPTCKTGAAASRMAGCVPAGWVPAPADYRGPALVRG